MRIVTNEKLIRRNKKIGQYLSIGSLVVLGIGLYMSFRPEYVTASFLALIVGFMISQVGIYYGNRWGRTPRPDESINLALKGLDNRFTLYHYVTPVAHLLTGPTGVWVLLPFHQRGKITYEKGRWRQKGGNFYMKIFAQEGLGRPEVDVQSAVADMEKYLKGIPNGETLLPVNAALVFTNPETVVEAPDAPVTALNAEKLKDFFRQRLKNRAQTFTAEQINVLERTLPGTREEGEEEEEGDEES